MTAEEIKKAIDDLFGDTSVSLRTTLDRLEDIVDHADSMIGALKDDIDKEEGA